MSINLKPEASLTAGLAVAGLTYGIWAISVPNAATIHATGAGDINVEAGRKKAAWTSVALVSAVALMARDLTIFTLGGLVVIALDWHARHANAVDNTTGKLVHDLGYHPAQDVPAAPVHTEADYASSWA